jgi:hypothetical protein
LYETPDQIADIKMKILDWVGYMNTIDRIRVSGYEVFERKTEGTRNVRSSRIGWPEDTENDLRELKLKKRKQKNNIREDWTSMTNDQGS